MDESYRSTEAVRHLYEEEKAAARSLKKEVMCYQQQMREAALTKEDAKRVRLKLKELQNVENLVKGTFLSTRDKSSNVCACSTRLYFLAGVTCWGSCCRHKTPVSEGDVTTGQTFVRTRE